MPISGPALDIPSWTLYQMLEFSASTYPDHIAVTFQGHALTYHTLLKEVRHVMAVLNAEGIRPGDRVGLMLPNCPQYVLAYYAVTGLGAIVVQISPLSAVPELEFYLQDSGCRLLIAHGSFLSRIEHARPATLEQVIAVSDDPSLPPSSAIKHWDPWVTQEGIKNVPPAPIDPDTTVAVLQYTGGTTGRSKGAMLTHRNLVANVFQLNHAAPIDRRLRPGDVLLCVLPLFHVYAMTVCLNTPIAFGATIVLLPRFDVQEILDVMRQYRPSVLAGVPTMFVALGQAVTEHPDILSSLRICMSGGAPLPLEVLSRFEQASGALLSEGFGLTEAAPVVLATGNPELRRIGSAGLPVACTEIKIVAIDDPMRELGAGEEGELAVLGPQVMKGYWNQPQETEKTLVQGWLLTGDIAKIDADGYTYIVDRKKDLIIVGGFNVYPREVEEVLYQHPAIREAAVVGVPDPYRGESVKAVVALNSGLDVTPEELKSWCRQHLAPYKVPYWIEVRPELPKSAVGKILRREVKGTPA